MSVLLNWFVENYTRKVAQCCPAEVSTLFDDIRSTGKIERAVNIVTDCKLKEMPYADFMTCSVVFELCTLSMFQFVRLDHMRKPLAVELNNLRLRPQDYPTAVASLRVAFKISIHGLSEDLLEVL